jgi:hypothetical protein
MQCGEESTRNVQLIIIRLHTWKGLPENGKRITQLHCHCNDKEYDHNTRSSLLLSPICEQERPSADSSVNLTSATPVPVDCRSDQIQQSDLKASLPKYALPTSFQSPSDTQGSHEGSPCCASPTSSSPLGSEGGRPS